MNAFSGAMAICPTCQTEYYRDHVWKLQCLNCYLAHKGKTAPTTRTVQVTTSPIEPDMLRRLIQLCHPDRHGGSESAHTATMYLLALRGTT